MSVGPFLSATVANPSLSLYSEGNFITLPAGLVKQVTGDPAKVHFVVCTVQLKFSFFS